MNVELLEDAKAAESTAQEALRSSADQVQAEWQVMGIPLDDAQEPHQLAAMETDAIGEALVRAPAADEASDKLAPRSTAHLALFEPSVAQLMSLLAAAEQRVETERQARRTDVVHLKTLLEAQRESRHEAEKKLARIEVEQHGLESSPKHAQGRRRLAAAPVCREDDPLSASACLDRPAPSILARPDAGGFAQVLKSLKVACIMDEFTFSSYRPECKLLQLSVNDWQTELDTFAPELLFIESAWRGKGDQWGSKVGHMSEEVVGIIECCRQRKIPTVFWNKEDQTHFATFLSTAKMFDYVFTTDIDCIHHYKAALGHDQVYLLPFACQPVACNPIETYQRKDAFCFAGAYHMHDPERTRDLGNFMTALAEYRPVDIYDRNHGKDDPNYQFPPEYRPFIIGNLPFEQIDKAYKGYRYAINLNSIKQSQSMFARRVFDLLASNTITVSNFSRGVHLLFGDLVITTDNGSEIVRRLQAIGGDDAQLRKFRLAGLRKVMTNHTYQDRLAYVVSKVQGKANLKLLPRIVVTAYAKNQQQFDVLLASFNRQSYAERRFIVVVPGGFAPEGLPDDGSVLALPVNACDDLQLGELTGGAELIAGMVPDDYYGPNYLLDLALATRYSTAPAIGKVTHHVWSDRLSLAFPGYQYLPARSIPARCALVRPALVSDMALREWVNSLNTRQIEAPDLLSVDEFNYCKNGGTTSFDATQADAVNDLTGLDHGLAAEELIVRAERIAPEEIAPDEVPILTGDRLASYFKPPTNKGYTLMVSGQGWEAKSSLHDGKQVYLYADIDLRPADFGFKARAQFHLDMTLDVPRGLDLRLVMLFLDAQKERISHIIKTANSNQDAAIPPGTEWIRLGLRICGGGAVRINALVLGHLRPAEVLGHAEREKEKSEKCSEKITKPCRSNSDTPLVKLPGLGSIHLPAAIIQLRRKAELRRDAKSFEFELLLPTAQHETAKQVQAVTQMAEVFKNNVHKAQSRLRVAAVMDEFTFHSYNPECALLQLHPDTCVQQLTEFKPDLLFIESAWKGLEGLWQTKISNNGPEINICIQWCKANQVPTMFWNKEDPVHFSTFIPLAQQVDYVFTTDIDCIPKYKHAIGHDRVFLLPFAAQPKTHNPIELFERKDAFNFAGSYYLRYPERQRDFAALIDTVKNFKTVDIYDRNFDNPHPHYTFPDNYKPMILGKLPFEEIDKAYKGYRYGINMNTIKQSQTMFARRVFELLASNTVVVSNFSRGVRLLFGDLVITSDEDTQLHRRLQGICNNDIAYRKLRLMGLRKVMMEHTYSHRLAYIRAKLSDAAYQPQLPAVAVLAVAGTVEEQARLLADFQSQSYPARTLYLLQAYGGGMPASAADIHTFTDAASCRNALEAVLDTTPLLAVFVAQDYYGPKYLTDLALASTYAPASAFGKVAQYQVEGAGCHLQQDGQQYRPATSLLARAALVRSASTPSGWLDSCIAQPATASLQLPDMLATDEFHYCRDGLTLSADVLREALEDLPLANQGTSFAHTLAPTAESLQANAGPAGTDDGLPQLSAETLFKLIPKPASKQLQLSFKDGTLQLQSTLPADKNGYIYANKRFTRQELNLVLNSQFRLEAENTIPDLRTIFEFRDADGQKISHAMNGTVGGKHALAIPSHCTTIRFGLRVQGPGNATIQRLVLGNHGERPAAIAGHSPYLVLTKQYPAYDDLYRYGFLHSRVRGYKEHGLLVDVFRINNEPGQVYREFEGIDVASGDAQLLDDTLKTGRYKHVLVHMLDENMWRVLERHLDQVKVTVWVHGAEIQVWQRREFEFERMTSEAIARQKKLSDKRVKFWHSILKAPHLNLHLVFVSKTFAREVESDLGLKLAEGNAHVSVIHNFVDGRLFPYQPKTASHRLKLLSIRSFATRKYGNDLTVAAILELAQRPFFNELQFHIVGDGDLFEETVAPLKAFSNVKLDRRFLTHQEIAKLQDDYGVFLNPTRWDSQGVSRDEAMSAGLVPITTNVAAIPEFVDESCGIVVPAEDYKAIADGVELLYKNPNIFLKLSNSAMKRVNQQCGFESTLRQELNIIR